MITSLQKTSAFPVTAEVIKCTILKHASHLFTELDHSSFHTMQMHICLWHPYNVHRHAGTAGPGQI